MMNNWFRKVNWLDSKSIIYCFIFLLLAWGVSCGGFNQKVNSDELYKLLNVSKSANTKQIRMAFKKIALEKHPDKNTVRFCDAFFFFFF